MLTPARGLNLIVNAVKYCDEHMPGEVEFSVASLLDREKTLKPLKESDSVAYLGSLEQVESLAQYCRSHCVLTLYDPKFEINRFAVSNKWGDAVFMETPIIVNRGVVTAARLVKAGAAIEMDFREGSLEKLLIEMIKNPEILKTAKFNVKKLSTQHSLYDEVIVRLFSKFMI